MQDPRQRLIEAATRPLADNAELKHAAADFLENRITDEGDPAHAMVARWETVDAGKSKSIWSIGLWVAVVAISAGVVVSDFDEIRRLVPWGKWLAAGSIFAPPPENAVDRVVSKLSDADKLLLFGDLTKECKSERKEALWRSDPENPAYFAEYSGAFISDNNNKLPPDFLETARRIDPTNAWFTYTAAAVEAREAVKSKRPKSKRVGDKNVDDGPWTWEILDQARFDRAVELVRKARSQPKYTDYSAVMLRKRLPLLPQESFIDQLDSGGCLSSISAFSSIRLRLLGDVIAAKAWSLGESGDVAGYQEISSDGELFLRRICNDETGSLVDELVNKVNAATLAKYFGPAAEKLGLEHDVARWKAVEKWMNGSKERRGSREFIVDGKTVKPGTITGGLLSGSIEMIARQAETQPPLTDADLKPMRLVSHELLSWALSYVLWAVMVLCAGLVASYRFRVSALSHRLARRVEDLLSPSDWGWIIAAGVMLPLVFVMAVNRLTPLGGRAFGVQGTAWLMPAGHFLGLLFLWLILPVQVARWRLAKRAGGFGFSKPSWMGWLAVAVAEAFVLMIGWAAISGTEGPWLVGLEFDLAGAQLMPWMFWAALTLAGMSVLWVIWLISLAMFGRSERHLYRATTSLVLVRAYAAALLVLALATVGFKASERYWFKQETLSKFDLTTPGWNVYEARVALQMRKELREILGYDR